MNINEEGATAKDNLDGDVTAERAGQEWRRSVECGGL